MDYLTTKQAAEKWNKSLKMRDVEGNQRKN